MSPFALLKKYLFEKFIHIYFYSVTVSLFNNFSHFYISANQFRFLTIAKLQHEHLVMNMLQKKLSPDFQLKPRLSIHHLNDIMLKLFMRTQEMVACNTFCLFVGHRKIVFLFKLVAKIRFGKNTSSIKRLLFIKA